MVYSTAKLLLEEGHILYCTARRVENMRELKRLGGKVIFYRNIEICSVIVQ